MPRDPYIREKFTTESLDRPQSTLRNTAQGRAYKVISIA
jgi:hypothetical protein